MNATCESFILRLLAAVSLLILVAGCTALKSGVELGRATGTLALAATVDPQSADNLTSARITLSNDGIRRESVLPVTGATITGSMTELPIGDWAVRIELMDQSGDTTHVGESTVRIYPNETVSAELKAMPLESQLEIVADLSGFPGAETIENVRVTFHNDRTVTLKPVEGEPLRYSGVKELPPGDYDFSIALYTSTFYAADRVYTSPWTHVRLTAGKTSRVVWQGQTGDTVIDTSIVDMPLPPHNLSLDVRDGEIWLSWQVDETGEPPSAFRIYHRKDPYAAYGLMAEIPGNAFEHPIGKAISASPEAMVAVTAVSLTGLESYRSEPAPLSAVVE